MIKKERFYSPPAGWGIMLTSSMIPIVNMVSTSLFPLKHTVDLKKDHSGCKKSYQSVCNK